MVVAAWTYLAVLLAPSSLPTAGAGMSLVNQRFTMNVAPIMEHTPIFYTLVGTSDTSVGLSVLERGPEEQLSVRLGSPIVALRSVCALLYELGVSRALIEPSKKSR